MWATDKTRFVERIWAGLLPTLGREAMHTYLDQYDGFLWDISYIDWILLQQEPIKIHTIRAGSRWIEGEMFSPKVWSGRPYHSHQVTFAPDLKITAAPIVHVRPEENMIDRAVYIGGKIVSSLEVAKNDGLNYENFASWFSKPFDGQCIIFGPENPYL